MKTLFVTGGCGFIGSNFIRNFLASHTDWAVVNFNKLTYSGNPQNLRDVEKSPRYRFIQGDICDAAAVCAGMKGAEAAIHFAAETHVDRSIDAALEFIRTNVSGAQVMLDAARECSLRRYLHISTDEVYGSAVKGSFDEDAPLKPNSPYSASKAGGDLLVRSHRETYGFPAIVIRSSNNYGPYQFPEKVIPPFITNLLEGKKVPLYK